MRILASMVIAVGLAVSSPAFAQDDAAPSQAALDDAAFDAQFQCPETIADHDGRIEEILRYQDWARQTHPAWNLRKRMDVRYGLLRRHACAVTLANVASSALPAFAR